MDQDQNKQEFLSELCWMAAELTRHAARQSPQLAISTTTHLMARLLEDYVKDDVREEALQLAMTLIREWWATHGVTEAEGVQ